MVVLTAKLRGYYHVGRACACPTSAVKLYIYGHWGTFQVSNEKAVDRAEGPPASTPLRICPGMIELAVVWYGVSKP